MEKYFVGGGWGFNLDHSAKKSARAERENIGFAVMVT